MTLLIIQVITAVLPALLLMWYIYAQDHLSHEPWLQIARAILFGVISAFIAIGIASPTALVSILFPDLQYTIAGSAFTAFAGAAIPEESAKLLMLWLLLRRNNNFDEHFDGIVYGACVGLGFGGFENILYVVQSGTDWMQVGLQRAIFSVPGHFFFGVFMGYYYSLVHFHSAQSQARHTWNIVATWLVPVLLHGFFDFFLFAADLRPAYPAFGSAAYIAFFVLCFAMLVLGLHKIKKLRNIDLMYAQLQDEFIADANRYDQIEQSQQQNPYGPNPV